MLQEWDLKRRYAYFLTQRRDKMICSGSGEGNIQDIFIWNLTIEDAPVIKVGFSLDQGIGVRFRRLFADLATGPYYVLDYELSRIQRSL